MVPQQLKIKTLCGYGAFTRVITRGKKYEKNPIKAFVYKSASEVTSMQIGFTVTKRIRKATQRNKIKRLMREAFRVQKKNYIRHIKPGFLVEIVFIYNGDIEIAPRKVRFASIDQAFTTICATINYNQ